MRWCWLILLLSGCTTWQKTRDVDRVTITKIETADAAQVCRNYVPDENVIACAVWSRQGCTIIVPPNNPELTGHEATHCFGWRH